MKPTEGDLITLESQAEFMAMSFGTKEWRLMAAAIKELRERREKEKGQRPLVRGHGPDCQCGICRRILVPNEPLE